MGPFGNQSEQSGFTLVLVGQFFGMAYGDGWIAQGKEMEGFPELCEPLEFVSSRRRRRFYRVANCALGGLDRKRSRGRRWSRSWLVRLRFGTDRRSGVGSLRLRF